MFGGRAAARKACPLARVEGMRRCSYHVYSLHGIAQNQEHCYVVTEGLRK